MTPELWGIILTTCTSGLVTCCGVCLALIFLVAFIENNHKNKVALLDSQITERMGTLNNLNKIIQERQQEILKSINLTPTVVTYTSDEELQKQIDNQMKQVPGSAKYRANKEKDETTGN